MPLTYEQEMFLYNIQEAAPGSDEEKDALAFIKDNAIEFEDDDFFWSPLITAIARKRSTITQALLAKGADIHYVTRSATTALSTAIRVKDASMVAFLHAEYKTRWPNGEDRIMVEELVALIDAYYPTDKIKTNTEIRDYRAELMPVLQGYRTQSIPLSEKISQALQKKIQEMQRLIQERDLATQIRNLIAEGITDEKKREAYLQTAREAHIAVLNAHNRDILKKAELEKKLEEEALERKLLEEKYKQLEEKHRQGEAKTEAVSQRLEHVEAKVNVLWLEHETEATIDKEKTFIRSQGKLKAFYDRMRRKLNDIFVGGQAARSGEVAVKDRSRPVIKGIELLGKLIPLPFSTTVATVASGLALIYFKYKEKKQTPKVHHGLTGLASEVIEWNEQIVDPVARRLTLLGMKQLPYFSEAEVEALAEYSVVLVLFYIIYDYDPKKTPAPSYAEVVQSLLLAVQFQQHVHQGKVLKDEKGDNIKAPLLSTHTTTGSAVKISAADVLRAFEHEVTLPSIAAEIDPRSALSLLSLTTQTAVTTSQLELPDSTRKRSTALVEQPASTLSLHPASANN